jgi:uncharacterized protein DUF4184
MPYTLAHPAAVLPLRSASRRHLALAPLAIGATMPDVQYFTQLAAEGRFTHSLPGLLLVCVPVGWIVLLLFDRFGRAGVEALLPRQWRLPEAPESRPVFLTSLALFIGSVTHVLWDAFTHDHGWVVRSLPVLRSPVADALPGVPWYSALQHGSTILGMLALAAAVWPWFREQPPVAVPQLVIRTSAVLVVLAAAALLNGLRFLHAGTRSFVVAGGVAVTFVVAVGLLAIGWWATRSAADGA